MFLNPTTYLFCALKAQTKLAEGLSEKLSQESALKEQLEVAHGSLAAQSQAAREMTQERVMRSIVLRIQQRTKAAALQKWTEQIEEILRRRVILTRAAAKIQKRTLDVSAFFLSRLFFAPL